MGRQGRDAVVDERGEDAPGDFFWPDVAAVVVAVVVALPSLSLSLLSRASSASRSAMRSSRVSTPSSSASPERFGAASLSASLSSSSLLLDAGVLSSTRSAAASPALLASLLLLSSRCCPRCCCCSLEAGGGGGGAAFFELLRFFASLEASLSLLLPIVNASRGQYWRVAVGSAALPPRNAAQRSQGSRDELRRIAQHSYDRFTRPTSVSPTARLLRRKTWES